MLNKTRINEMDMQKPASGEFEKKQGCRMRSAALSFGEGLMGLCIREWKENLEKTDLFGDIAGQIHQQVFDLVKGAHFADALHGEQEFQCVHHSRLPPDGIFVGKKRGWSAGISR